MKTIQIIDDSSLNIEILKNNLKDRYKILATPDPVKGLALIKRKKPDLVLLDIIMPEMTGYEVMEKIQADEEIADIPVIFITGKTSEEDYNKGLEMGALAYIKKPFDMDNINALISSCFDSM